MDNPDIDYFIKVQLTISSIFAVIYSPFHIAIQVKRNIKLDKMYRIQLLIFQSMMVLRIITVTLYMLEKRKIILIVDIVAAICLFIGQICLYIIIFQMAQVRNLINSNTLSVYVKGKIVTNRLKLFVMCLITIVHFLILTNSVVKLVIDGTDKESTSSVLSILSLIARCVRLLLDIFIFVYFIQIFLFFVNQKKRALEAQFDEFNQFNKMIIAWTLFVASFNVLRAVISFIGHALSFTEASPTSIEFTRGIVQYIIVTLTDGLNAISILYLCYFMGKQTYQKEIVFNSNRKHDTESLRNLLMQRRVSQSGSGYSPVSQRSRELNRGEIQIDPQVLEMMSQFSKGSTSFQNYLFDKVMLPSRFEMENHRTVSVNMNILEDSINEHTTE